MAENDISRINIWALYFFVRGGSIYTFFGGANLYFLCGHPVVLIGHGTLVWISPTRYLHMGPSPISPFGANVPRHYYYTTPIY